MAYFFKQQLNITAGFITNASDIKTNGSSLYLVLPEGTIRCSGSCADDRSPTTFVRPYLVAYVHERFPSVFWGKPALGTSPYEAKARNYVELAKQFNDTKGHLGSIITEIFSMDELFSKDFKPKTWVGAESDGIDWVTAKFEVMSTFKLVNEDTRDFRKTTRPLLRSPLPEAASAPKPKPEQEAKYIPALSRRYA